LASAAPGHRLRRVASGSPWIAFNAAIAPGSAPAAPIDGPWLGTGCNFALLAREAGQHLSLLALGHVEVIQGVGQFRGDFVEHLGWDLQVEMCIAQLSAGVLEWPPASEASHKVRSHLRPGNRPG
jgi:hypothetical protein